MTAGPEYSPKPIFSLEETGRETPPFGLIAPARYVQGPGLLDELGHFLALVPSTRPAVLISAGGLRRHREQLLAGLGAMESEPVFEVFEGQCCLSEIERAAASLRARKASFDSLIAVGGGKCLDAGKSVAARLEVPAVICPTIASTDAPCSALSVIYSDEGIVEAPGDAMARGLVHRSDDRRADQAGDDADAGARRDPDADRAEELHGVEAQHRADQGGAHGQCRGELAAGARDHAGHRLQRAREGGVGRGERRIGADQHRGRRDGRGPERAFEAPLPRAPHRAAPPGAGPGRSPVPSSEVEARRRVAAQASRSARR